MKYKINFKDVLKSVAQGIIVINLEGYLVDVNDEFADLLGYKKNELIGKHIVDICPFNIPKYLEGDSASIKKKLEIFGSVQNHETQYSRKDGTVIFAEVNISSLKDDENKLIGYVTAVRLIMDRKSSELKLRESEGFLRNIINTDPNLIFVKHRSGKYIELSEGLAELFGTTVDVVIGKTDLSLAEIRKLSIIEAKKIRQDDLDVINTGKRKFIAEESITQKDGTIKWYQTTKVPLVRNNKADYVLGVAVDITLQKQTIDLLKEKKNELKTKNMNLEELHAALKIVLQQKENDKEELEKKVLSSIKNLVEPYMNKLKDSSQNNSQKIFIEIIESNLKEIVSNFSLKLSSEYINLTAYEIQVADLIRKDFANKEIAEQLNMALETVSSHRKHIRKKLGITNKKTNLSSHLKFFQ